MADKGKLLEDSIAFVAMHGLDELTTSRVFSNGYKATIVIEKVTDEETSEEE